MKSSSLILGKHPGPIYLFYNEITNGIHEMKEIGNLYEVPSHFPRALHPPHFVYYQVVYLKGSILHRLSSCSSIQLTEGGPAHC